MKSRLKLVNVREVIDSAESARGDENVLSTVEWKPATASELARMLASNYGGDQTPVIPVGGRTALHYGGPVPRESVCVLTAELQRVVDYPVRDMTITVESGLRVEGLQGLLAENGQRLPVDVAQSHRATIGGAIASNTSGPGRYGYGTFRDYVIGISAVDGQGRLFSAGGRVVKNVAGYDLCKLLIGSLGTLAVITQVTLKLRPLVTTRAFACLASEDLSQVESWLERLNLSATRPVVLDLLNSKAFWQLRNEARVELPDNRYLLCIGYEGTQREVDWQLETVRQEIEGTETGLFTAMTGEAADRIWSALVEFQATSDDPLTFQASLLPSQVLTFVRLATERGIAVQAHAGNGIVIGHLPDRISHPGAAAELVRQLRDLAAQYHGRLIVLSCDDQWKESIGMFGEPFAGAAWMNGIKQALDPAGILSPGRI